MHIDINAAVEAAKDRWHTPSGLLLALLAGTVALLGLFAAIDLRTLTLFHWLVLAVVLAAISISWWRTRLPTVQKGYVGIGVAVLYETEQVSSAVRADLVEQLRTLLHGSRFKQQFRLVEFNAAVSRRLADSPEQAPRLMFRTNVHFLLIGRVRARDASGGRIVLIDLRAVIRHARLPINVSEQLSREMGAALPRRVVVPEGQFAVAELAAAHLDVVSRYIIGTAAALSNDLDYSEKLLLDAEHRLRQVMQSADGAPLSALLGRIHQRLQDVHEGQLGRAMRRFTHRRDLASLSEGEAIVDRLRRYNPNHYGARLCAAMCAFLLHNDTQRAKAEISACRSVEDGAWRYSEAFLLAFDGDLDGAYKSYRHAFKSPLEDPTVPIQCEEFIQAVIDSKPDIYWLYYSLGLINHRVKGDLTAASTDFRAFLAQADVARFPTQVAVVKRWLVEIETELSTD